MKTLKLPITNGTFLASDVTVSGTNESTTHNVYVAFTQADSGYVAIQYKVSGSNNWQPMGKVDLTDTEVATFKVSGVITDWRFIVADASGTGSIEVTDSEKLEDIHPLSFYGETGGMSPTEIGDAIKLFGSYANKGAWATGIEYTTGDVWTDSGDWYLVLETYTSGASAAADIASGVVAQYEPASRVTQVYTIADLRNTNPIIDGQQIELLGHTNPGVGGGIFWYDASDTTTADDNGVTIVTAGGKRWKRKLNGVVNLSMFGGVPDFNRTLRTGTDNQTSLDAAEQLCYDNKLKLIIDGDYGVGSATVARPITRHGIGKENSGLFALADNHRIYTWSASYTSGTSVMYDFTMRGYAETNTTQGSDDSALVEIGPIDYAFFIEMDAGWGRQMGFKSRARVSWADKNHIHHLLRDGINFTDSEIRIMRGNVCEYIADDPLCAHSNATNVKTKTIITDNVLFNTYGIKCLSSEFTIANNRGEMIWGYGVQFGDASGFAEGAVDIVSSSITGNSFKNIINMNKVSASNIGMGIYSRPIFESNANGVFPGDYDTTLNVFVDPLANVDVYGDGMTHAGSIGVTISDNDIIQTWTGGTTISDYGAGEAWTTSGFVDCALTGTLGKDGNSISAYRFDGVAENIKLRPGTTYGVTTGILFQNVKRLRNFDGEIGQMARIYDKAISIVKDSSVSVLNCHNAHISDGCLDMDPMHEHPDREIISGEPTGAWTDTSGIDCNGIYCPFVRGFVWEGTLVKNVKRIATVLGGGAITPIIKGLTIFRGDGTGVGVVNAAYDQNSVYTDCDPRSATFGEVLQGNLYPRSTLPTSDYFFAGQRIRNSDYSATIGGSTFVEMVRLTTGNGHVLGTDWKIVPLS